MVACSGSVLISILNENLTDCKFQCCMIDIYNIFHKDVRKNNRNFRPSL